MPDLKTKQKSKQTERPPDQAPGQNQTDAFRPGGNLLGSVPSHAIRRRSRQRAARAAAVQEPGSQPTPAIDAGPTVPTGVAETGGVTTDAQLQPAAAEGETPETTAAERILGEARQEVDEHAEDWATGGTLDTERLNNTHFKGHKGGYKGQFKCNVFVGEMLVRAGLMAPGTKGEGAEHARYPDVNELARDVEALKADGKVSGRYGVDWFDLVDQKDARPGDLVMVRGKDRRDVPGHMPNGAENHGHIAFLSKVIHEDGTGAIKEISTIEATSHGAKEKEAGHGRMTWTDPRDKGAIWPEVMIIRPREQAR